MNKICGVCYRKISKYSSMDCLVCKKILKNEKKNKLNNVIKFILKCLKI